MTPTIKGWIAREWLIFLACFIPSLIILYLIALTFREPDWTPGRVFQELVEALFSANRLRDGAWIGWLVIMGPYLILLLVRSIIWSVNALRRH
jgi:hypothetical protein